MAVYGTELLVNGTVQRIIQKVNRELELSGILVTRFTGHVNVSKESLQAIRSRWGDKVFSTEIKQSVRAQEAAGAGQPLLQYDSHGPLSKAYRCLANELIKDQAYAQETIS